MPNDVNWGCSTCAYYKDKWCLFENIKVKKYDLCPDWEPTMEDT